VVSRLLLEHLPTQGAHYHPEAGHPILDTSSNIKVFLFIDLKGMGLPLVIRRQNRLVKREQALK
jgi:hypothetical protein